MKREILFKAKRVDNGEWVEGLPIYLTEYAKDFNEIDGIQCNKTRDNFDINTETVCQFTGLLDKNGNKIFEGDKLRFYYKDGKYDNTIISYLESGCRFVAIEEGQLEGYGFGQKNEMEIIGNIHD